MGRLKTLAPRLAPSPTARVKTLDVKAGATERERGAAWMAKRQRVALAYQYRCARCGRLWLSRRDEIDHIIPLEQGGSNDESNLQPLCASPCHEQKTKEEAAARARGRASPL